MAFPIIAVRNLHPEAVAVMARWIQLAKGAGVAREIEVRMFF